jgi:hypothetical protein
MPAHVQLAFIRTHDIELGQRVAVYWNGLRRPDGEGDPQGGAADVDYDTALCESSAIWPAGGKCGLGPGRLGHGSLGAGQHHGPANYGLGLGHLGTGQLGLFTDRRSWSTTKATPRLAGLRDGPYRFGVRFLDVLGNRDAAAGPEATIVVKNTPRPPQNVTATPGPGPPGRVTLNWTHSRDVT